jgi:hypothetical protein
VNSRIGARCKALSDNPQDCNNQLMIIYIRFPFEFTFPRRDAHRSFTSVGLVAAQTCRSRFRLSSTSRRKTFFPPGAGSPHQFAICSHRHRRGLLLKPSIKPSSHSGGHCPRRRRHYLTFCLAAAAAIRHWSITKPTTSEGPVRRFHFPISKARGNGGFRH